MVVIETPYFAASSWAVIPVLASIRIALEVSSEIKRRGLMENFATICRTRTSFLLVFPLVLALMQEKTFLMKISDPYQKAKTQLLSLEETSCVFISIQTKINPPTEK